MKFSAAFFTVSFSPRSESVSCFLQSKFSPSKVFGCNTWVHAKAFTVCLWGGEFTNSNSGDFPPPVKLGEDRRSDHIKTHHTSLKEKTHKSVTDVSPQVDPIQACQPQSWKQIGLICSVLFVVFSIQCFRCGNIGCWLFSRREEQVLLVMWQFPSIGQCCPTTNRRESVYWSSRIRILDLNSGGID